jgi:RNA recognition motif-containing protein
MGPKLYVGNLPYDITDDELHALFATFGAVRSVRVIRDAASGKGYGFAFVEMSRDSEAERAAVALKRTALSRGNLVVHEARREPE